MKIEYYIKLLQEIADKYPNIDIYDWDDDISAYVSEHRAGPKVYKIYAGTWKRLRAEDIGYKKGEIGVIL